MNASRERRGLIRTGFFRAHAYLCASASRLGVMAVAVGALVVGGVLVSTVAVAAPTPDVGPTSGGTAVSDGMPGLTFTEAVGGAFFSVAVGSDGNTYSWGGNFAGQLGDGSTASSSVPVLVQASDGVSFHGLSAGDHHVVALGSDGNTYAWGGGFSGELGNGGTASSALPVLVQSPAGVTFNAVSAGSHHSAAIGSDGKVYSWGQNVFGQLGDGTQIDSNVPVLVQAPAGVTFTHIAAGDEYTVAIASDGNTYAWGRNDDGQLGEGETVPFSAVPLAVQVPVGVTLTSIAAGRGNFTLATGSDGNTYGWGYNGAGQLGDGSTITAPIPTAVLVPSGIAFTSVTAGTTHSVAIGSDGNTYAWGNNAVGQLGDGTTSTSLTPILVQMPVGVTFDSVSAGDTHTVAVGSDGNAYSWGSNFDGELGNNSFDESAVPVQVVPAGPIVSSVTFGGVAATTLTQAGSTWTALTPGGCGTVDVAVSYTLYGLPYTATTTGGFTYAGAAVAVTSNPADATPLVGANAILSAAATGDPNPSVQWQRYNAATSTWEDIPGATSSSYAPSTQDVGASEYRAAFANCYGIVTSQTATVTVSSPVATPPAENLANSGGQVPWQLLLAALGLVLVGISATWSGVGKGRGD